MQLEVSLFCGWYPMRTCVAVNVSDKWQFTLNAHTYREHNRIVESIYLLHILLVSKSTHSSMILKNRILFSFKTLFSMYVNSKYETRKPQNRLFRQTNRGAEKETYLIFSLKMRFQTQTHLIYWIVFFETTFVFNQRYRSQLEPVERLWSAKKKIYLLI